MASGAGAVVDIVAAVVPGPAVHAHALVAAVGVVARAAILAGVGHQLALVDVIPAKLTCGGGGRGRGGGVWIKLLGAEVLNPPKTKTKLTH